MSECANFVPSRLVSFYHAFLVIFYGGSNEWWACTAPNDRHCVSGKRVRTGGCDESPLLQDRMGIILLPLQSVLEPNGHGKCKHDLPTLHWT